MQFLPLRQTPHQWKRILRHLGQAIRTWVISRGPHPSSTSNRVGVTPLHLTNPSSVQGPEMLNIARCTLHVARGTLHAVEEGSLHPSPPSHCEALGSRLSSEQPRRIQENGRFSCMCSTSFPTKGVVLSIISICEFMYPSSLHRTLHQTC